MDSSQAQLTRERQRVLARIARLNRVFDEDGQAKWWNAFKRGPLTYWLPYYFDNDEIGLWDVIYAKISDILKDKMKASSERSGEIKKRLTALEADLKVIRAEYEAKKIVIETDLKLAQAQKNSQDTDHDLYLARLDKHLENREERRSKVGSKTTVTGAFVDWSC